MWVEPRKKKELKESLKEMIDNQAMVNKELVEGIVKGNLSGNNVDTEAVAIDCSFKEDDSIPQQRRLKTEQQTPILFSIDPNDLKQLEKTVKSPSFISGLATGTFLTFILGYLS